MLHNSYLDIERDFTLSLRGGADLLSHVCDVFTLTGNIDGHGLYLYNFMFEQFSRVVKHIEPLLYKVSPKLMSQFIELCKRFCELNEYVITHNFEIKDENMRFEYQKYADSFIREVKSYE